MQHRSTQMRFEPKEALPLSFSGLKQFAKSPAHFVHYKTAPYSSSAAMRRGTLVHRMILEPEKMHRMHIIDASTRANKAFKEAESEHGEYACLQKEFDEAEAIAAAVKRHSYANNTIWLADQREKHMHWECEGLQFHGFPDAYGNGVLLDLKVTNPEPKKFQRMVMDQAYHMQLAMYRMAMKQPVECFWVVVDPSPPYTCAVYKPSNDMLEDGVKMARLEARMYLHWMENWDNRAKVLGFDHYDQGQPMTLELPSWHR